MNVKDQAIYIPDNPHLWCILDDRPRTLAAYRQHVMLFLHFICSQLWSRQKDEKGQPGEYSNLNAKILREYIPNRILPPIKDFLKSQGVVETRNHSAKRHATGYRITEAFNGPPRRQIITDPVLSSKLLCWRSSFGGNSINPELQAVINRRQLILEHMRSDLSALGLRSYEGVFQQALREGITEKHASYVCQLIHNGDHDKLTVDDFGWRVHSVATRTAKIIRSSFLIDNQPTNDIDISNMQPLMLSLMITPPSIQSYNQECYTNMLCKNWIKGVRICEAGEYKDLCQSGQLYESLMDATGFVRDKVKHELIRDVLFGKLDARGQVKDAFAQKWPSIYASIIQMKLQYGYKIIAQCLQRLESSIMIDGVCGRLVRQYPHIRFLTIHDSVLAANEYADIVNNLIIEEFEQYGIRCNVSRNS